MARVAFSQTGNTPFERLLGHNPDVLEKWTALEVALWGSSTFSPHLKEQVRRVLAFGNQCEYCMAKGRPNDVHPDPKEALAVAFAQAFVQDRGAIDESSFEVLREEFSEAEIAELTAFISFVTAAQRFGAALALQPASR